MKNHDYEEDIDVRLQREMNKKIEKQLISLCLSIGDEHLIDTFERLSEENGRKITIKPSISPLKSEKKSSSSSSMKIVPNIVNISIDSSSNSRQSSANSLNRFYWHYKQKLLINITVVRKNEVKAKQLNTGISDINRKFIQIQHFSRNHSLIFSYQIRCRLVFNR